MILKIGTYSTLPNAQGCVLVERYSISSVVDPRTGVPLRQKRSLAVRVHVKDAGQAALKTRIEEVETAVLTTALADGAEVQVLHDDNATISPHSLNSGARLGDIRATLNWQPTQGIEYANERTYVANFEADYDLTGSSDNITLSLNETFRQQGFGGGDYRWTQPITGTPVAVQVRSATPYTIVQSGSAVGYRDYYDSTPVSAWVTAGYYRSNKSSKSNGQPQLINGEARRFPSSWSYTYEHSSSLGAGGLG